MKFGPFEGVVQRAYLRLYDIFSPKKHLTIRAFHPIIYIIGVVLSADSKERRRQDEKANRKHPACPVYAAVPYANSGFCGRQHGNPVFFRRLFPAMNLAISSDFHNRLSGVSNPSRPIKQKAHTGTRYGPFCFMLAERG